MPLVLPNRKNPMCVREIVLVAKCLAGFVVIGLILTGCSSHQQSTNASPEQVQAIMQQAKVNSSMPPGGPRRAKPGAASPHASMVSAGHNKDTSNQAK